jgi:hypothetical protein
MRFAVVSEGVEGGKAAASELSVVFPQKDAVRSRDCDQTSHVT